MASKAWNLRSSSPDVFEQQLERRARVLRMQDFAAAVRSVNRRRAASQTPTSSEDTKPPRKELCAREKALEYVKAVQERPAEPVKRKSRELEITVHALASKIMQSLRRHDEDRELVRALFSN